MNEATAKKQLRRLLTTYTAGTLLHLLGDVYRELAEEARQHNDVQGLEQYTMVEAALVVVGMGLDAACPR